MMRNFILFANAIHPFLKPAHWHTQQYKANTFHFAPNGMSTAGGFSSFPRFSIFEAEAHDTDIQSWIKKACFHHGLMRGGMRKHVFQYIYIYIFLCMKTGFMFQNTKWFLTRQYFTWAALKYSLKKKEKNLSSLWLMNYFPGSLKSLALDLQLCQERGFELMWLM